MWYIGAGIGGLTLAVALKKKGISSQIFEAAPEIKAVGAGIWLPPNAINILKRIDLDERIKSSGFSLNSIEIRDHKDKQISKITGDWLMSRYNNRTLSIERNILHKLLAAELNPGQIITDFRCNSINQANSSAIVKIAEKELVFDCIIAADGINSSCRESVFQNRNLRYSGQTCFRGLIVCEKIPELNNGAIEVWGNGCRFGLSPINENKFYWYSTVNSKSGQKLSVTEILNILKNEFNQFPNYIKNFIKKIEANPKDIIQTDLFDLAPNDCWVNKRIALLGDAAHATTPNLGQGAAMAIEDAFVLAEEMSLTDRPEIAFYNYNEKRRHRVKSIVTTSWKMGQMSAISHPMINRIRNVMMRSIPDFLITRQLDRIYKTEIAG